MDHWLRSNAPRIRPAPSTPRRSRTPRSAASVARDASAASRASTSTSASEFVDASIAAISSSAAPSAAAADARRSPTARDATARSVSAFTPPSPLSADTSHHGAEQNARSGVVAVSQSSPLAIFAARLPRRLGEEREIVVAAAVSSKRVGGGRRHRLRVRPLGRRRRLFRGWISRGAPRVVAVFRVARRRRRTVPRPTPARAVAATRHRRRDALRLAKRRARPRALARNRRPTLERSEPFFVQRASRRSRRLPPPNTRPRRG